VDVALLYSKSQVVTVIDWVKFEFNDIKPLYLKKDSEKTVCQPIKLLKNSVYLMMLL